MLGITGSYKVLGDDHSILDSGMTQKLAIGWCCVGILERYFFD